MAHNMSTIQQHSNLRVSVTTSYVDSAIAMRAVTMQCSEEGHLEPDV